ANTLAQSYLQHQRGDKLQDNNRIEGYLNSRIAELRDQVEKSEKAVADYRRDNNLYDVQSTTLSAQELSQVNTQLITAQTAKAEADAKLQEAIAAKNGSAAVPEVLSSPLIQALKEQQAQADKNVAQLSAIYGPRHPKMLDAAAQAGDLRRKIGME